MAELRQSSLLTFLISQARDLGKHSVKAPTTERFLAVACRCMLNKHGMADRVKRELRPLIEYLESRDLEPKQVQDNLLLFINRGADGDSAKSLDRALELARIQAEQNGALELTADLVLEQLLNDLSDAARRSLSKAPLEEASEKKETTGETFSSKTRAVLDRLEAQGVEAARALLELLGPEKAKEVENELNQMAVRDSKQSDRARNALRALFYNPKAEKEPSQEQAPQAQAKADEAEAQPEVPVSPTAEISRLVAKVKQTRSALLQSIFGQDYAVGVFTNGYFKGELSAMTEGKRSRPRATFLFAGPPGVGKTFLSETAAKELGLPYLRLDMSEYNEFDGVARLCGNDPMYHGSKNGILTDFVKKNPKCVVLLDEVEKAHINVIHLFLQVLDAGRLQDGNSNEEVSFVDTILIFTTNAGRSIYENAESGDFSGLSRKVILRALSQEIDPNTRRPFFPDALCSRFGSGNVVMFNHMSAPFLRDIARKEILNQAAALEKATGIRTKIDERVFTALLLSEGGSADARMVKGRAQNFYHEELFDLFRLVDSEKVVSSVADITGIELSLQLPDSDPAIVELFAHSEEMEILVFADHEVADRVRAIAPQWHILDAQRATDAEKILKEREIHMILLDAEFGPRQDLDYLNIEDIESEARDLFWMVRDSHRDVPIYLLESGSIGLHEEERLSFLREGAHGVVALRDGDEAVRNRLQRIADDLQQEKSVTALASANKLLTFKTAQRISPDGTQAEIRLFDLGLHTAVDASDGQNVLSAVSRPEVYFEQVIGAKDAKDELRFFLDYLRDPKKFLGTGLTAPKGVLLYGPPGTGKTMLAKALACESGVTFIAAEGNQFFNKYYGEGTKAIHNLFRTARKYAPSVLFVDEIDAIAKPRTGGDTRHQADELLTAFLTEMDGFHVDPSRPVFVLAATNYDVDPSSRMSLDQAFLRRFDRRIRVDLPDREERTQYLKMMTEKKPVFDLSDGAIDNISLRSTGMSLAALASVLEFSKRLAVRSGELKVTDAILEEAFETFISGEEKHWDSSQLERTARHEAGHAFLYWKSGNTPSYLTIVARGDHGGYMQHGDTEKKGGYTRAELLDLIRTSLGGRASEIVYYGQEGGLSTGASSDLQNATNTARQLLCRFGMDEDFGLAVISQEEIRSGPLSEKVRDAVNRILEQEMKNAVDQIRENREAIDRLVAALIDKTHLMGDEIDRILRGDAPEA